MTLNECITTVDNLCPNRIDNNVKVMWINNAEGRLSDGILREYEDVTIPPEYDPSTDMDTQLYLSGHWTEYYVHYVMAQIYLALHEQKHANNEELIYSEVYEDFRIFCAKNHKRKSYRYGVR